MTWIVVGLTFWASAIERHAIRTIWVMIRLLDVVFHCWMIHPTIYALKKRI